MIMAGSLRLALAERENDRVVFVSNRGATITAVPVTAISAWHYIGTTGACGPGPPPPSPAADIARAQKFPLFNTNETEKWGKVANTTA
jgi:hypothetical protein